MIFRKRGETEGYVNDRLNDVSIEDRSTPSYALHRATPREAGHKVLSRVFGIPDDIALQEAYDQASGGQGNESGNLLTLHSSALLALLCFYNVGKTPVRIRLSDADVEYEFDKVYFEIENIVQSEADRNSSIDLALWSTESKVMLLLESKFTEPTKGAKITDVSEKYYDRLSLLSDCGITLVSKSGRKSIVCDKQFIGDTERMPYYEGVKQMIAHIIGVETRPALVCELSKKTKELKKRKQIEYAENFKAAEKIYLGTILFDDPAFFDESEYDMIQFYKNLYRRSMKEIAKTLEGDRIELLIEPLTYQDIFCSASRNEIASKISKFYNFKIG